MATHLLVARQIEVATNGQLNDGDSLTLRVNEGQGGMSKAFTRRENVFGTSSASL